MGPSEIIEVDSLKNKNVVISQSGKFVDPKHSGKGLNHEDLETRFFPHDKLLGSQRSSSASREQASNLLRNNGDQKLQEWSLILVDENLVALEVLASLTTEQSNPDKDKIMPAIVSRMGMEGTSVAKCASRKGKR